MAPKKKAGLTPEQQASYASVLKNLQSTGVLQPVAANDEGTKATAAAAASAPAAEKKRKTGKQPEELSATATEAESEVTTKAGNPHQASPF